MARSRRDQRGKRTNGAILGHGELRVVGDRIVATGGGTEVGSAARKRDAKDLARRKRRAWSHLVTRRDASEARA